MFFGALDLWAPCFPPPPSSSRPLLPPSPRYRARSTEGGGRGGGGGGDDDDDGDGDDDDDDDDDGDDDDDDDVDDDVVVVVVFVVVIFLLGMRVRCDARFGERTMKYGGGVGEGMRPGGLRFWRIPYPMRAVAIPVADPQLEVHWLPDPGFLIQGFLIQGLRRRLRLRSSA